MENSPENLDITAVRRSDDEHQSVAGRYPHYTFRRVKPSLSDVEHSVDWWRVPDAPKGLLNKLLHAIKRKWRSWRI